MMRHARTRAVYLLALLPLGCGHGGSGASDAGSSPFGANPTAAQGQAAVELRDCAKCHQSQNASDGVLSGQTTPVPGTESYGSNLTPDPDTGMDAWDAATIENAILSGVDDQGQVLCPDMHRLGSKGVSVDEALAIAAYLQTLTPVWHAIPASTCDRPSLTADAGR
jgi:hypothetical protein